MANYRRHRLNDSIKEELCIILREVKDPRVSDYMITITAADVTPDLKEAKIYYSVLGECDEREVKRGMFSAGPFMRSQLAKRLNLRMTPELTFVRDRSAERGNAISAILRSIETKETTEDGEVEETEE